MRHNETIKSEFQLTRPVRGEPVSFRFEIVEILISTHSPRAGRTNPLNAYYWIKGHFNSLAPCGANLDGAVIDVVCFVISTHSPRAGRTCRRRPARFRYWHFNSLAPCGANQGRARSNRQHAQFQLTRPVRGEPRSVVSDRSTAAISTHSPRAGRTTNIAPPTTPFANFNSLAPCGANPIVRPRRRSRAAISTHSPRAGRTCLSSVGWSLVEISTHSPRAGRTISSPPRSERPSNFNSLAPCGANPAAAAYNEGDNQFQLTRPVRGEPRG